MTIAFRLISTLFAVLFGFSAQVAEAQKLPAHDELIAQENRNTIRLASGDIGDASTFLAAELSALLGEPGKLRILPVLSGSGSQAVSDLLYLQGIDVALVRADVLSYLRREQTLGDIDERVRYIAKLHAEQMHVIAASSVGSLADLAGKSVNFEGTVTAGRTSGELVFEKLGIDVNPVHLGTIEALEQIRSGEIAAMVVVDRKPNGIVSTLHSADGLKLLPVGHSEVLQDQYRSADLTSQDYPNLIGNGNDVSSLEVDVVLVTYNWREGHTRQSRMVRFIDAFYTKFSRANALPQTSKWATLDLSSELPNWHRFAPAQTWLDENLQRVAAENALADLKVSFGKFLEQAKPGSGAALSEEEERSLFKDFLSSPAHGHQILIPIYKTEATGVGAFIGTIGVKNTMVTIGKSEELALQLEPKLIGLPPGPHAFHIHEMPDCGPEVEQGVPVPGLAGGGLLHVKIGDTVYANHVGNLPGLVADRNGNAEGTIIVPRLNVADLLDRSIMIHQTGNDLSARFACGKLD